jgi:hypothetical protein
MIEDYIDFFLSTIQISICRVAWHDLHGFDSQTDE